MSGLILNLWIAGALLVALALVRRRRGLAALVLALAAVVSGLVRGFLIPADLLHLPEWAGLSRECAALIAWGLWSAAAQMAPAPWLPGPRAVSAGLAGALFGEVSGAALAVSGAPDRQGAVSLALAASAGALLGRVGDPVLLALGDRVSALYFVPLALILWAVAARGAPQERLVEGDRRVTALGVLVAVGAAVAPAYAWAIVLVGAASLLGWGLRRRAPLAPLGQQLGFALGSVVLVLVAISSGLVDLGTQGLTDAISFLGPAPPWLLAAGGVIGGALFDGPSAGLVLAGLIDRSLDMPFRGFEVPIALGAAAGGLGPLVAVGAVRAGLRRWLFGMLIVALYAVLISRWIPVD